MKPEYWQLPDTMAKFREPVYNDLVEKLTAKIEYIEYCYSQGDKLTENQFNRLKQDEELIELQAEYSNLLASQLEKVLNDYMALCEQFTLLMHQKNKIQMEYLNKTNLNLKEILNHGKAAA